MFSFFWGGVTFNVTDVPENRVGGLTVCIALFKANLQSAFHKNKNRKSSSYNKNPTRESKQQVMKKAKRKGRK